MKGRSSSHCALLCRAAVVALLLMVCITTPTVRADPDDVPNRGRNLVGDDNVDVPNRGRILATPSTRVSLHTAPITAPTRPLPEGAIIELNDNAIELVAGSDSSSSGVPDQGGFEQSSTGDSSTAPPPTDSSTAPPDWNGSSTGPVDFGNSTHDGVDPQDPYCYWMGGHKMCA